MRTLKYTSLLLWALLATSLFAAGLFTYDFFQHASIKDAQEKRQTPQAWQYLSKTPFLEVQPKTFQAYSLKKTTLILNFWASWCEPCAREIPLLNQYAPKFAAKNVPLFGINYEDVSTIQTFMQKHPPKYPFLKNENIDLMSQLGNGFGMMPYTVFIDVSGKIIEWHIGELKPEILDAWLKKADALAPSVGASAAFISSTQPSVK